MTQWSEAPRYAEADDLAQTESDWFARVTTGPRYSIANQVDELHVALCPPRG
jgi:hypothetical protein